MFKVFLQRKCVQVRIATPCIAVLAFLAVMSRSDAAEPVTGMLAQHHCDLCHAVDTALIGPPFIAVAARYGAMQDKQRTLDVLAFKILNGGAGNWGSVPMVPNTLITFVEARKLAEAVLELDPNTHASSTLSPRGTGDQHAHP